MTKLARTRLAIAAALLGVVSITSVGATALTADAGASIAKRSGDIWCC